MHDPAQRKKGVDMRNLGRFSSLFPAPDVNQCRDTGLVMVLVTLVAAHFAARPRFIPIAIGFLLVSMAAPGILKPIARVWFGVSHLWGLVASKIFLSLVFVVLVVPVGLFRRVSGFDSLQLGKWKKGGGSVFKVRKDTFGRKDMEHPY